MHTRDDKTNAPVSAESGDRGRIRQERIEGAGQAATFQNAGAEGEPPPAHRLDAREEGSGGSRAPLTASVAHVLNDWVSDASAGPRPAAGGDGASGGGEVVARSQSGTGREPASDSISHYAQAQAAQEGTRGSRVSLPHRERLESAFGRDLGEIPVHDGAEARKSAGALNAHAFQVNGSIVLGERRDLRTVAEEVAHVEQFRIGGSGAAGLTSPSGAAELEASAAASAIVSGGAAPALSQGLGEAAVARSDDKEAEEKKQKALADARSAADSAKQAKSTALNAGGITALLGKIDEALSKCQAAVDLGAGAASGMLGELQTLKADANTAQTALPKIQAAIEALTPMRECNPGAIQAKVDAATALVDSVPGSMSQVIEFGDFRRLIRNQQKKVGRAEEFINLANEVVAKGGDEASVPPGPQRVQILVRRQQELNGVARFGQKRPQLDPPPNLASALSDIHGKISSAIAEGGISANDMLAMQAEYGAEIGLTQGKDDSYGITVGTEGNVGLQEGHRMLAHTHPNAKDDIRKELPSAGGGDLNFNSNVQAVIHDSGVTMFGPGTTGSDIGDQSGGTRHMNNVVGVNTTDVNLAGTGGQLSLTHNQSGANIGWDGQNAPQVSGQGASQMPQGTVRHIQHAGYSSEGQRQETLF